MITPSKKKSTCLILDPNNIYFFSPFNDHVSYFKLNKMTNIVNNFIVMDDFWEKSFRVNKEMWGWKPTGSAINTAKLFKNNGFKNVLIPGFGYGRNAKIFIEIGFNVTGIEISESAIEIANNHFGDKVKIHHGSVNDMPFEEKLYDGIYCYSLIHLLNKKDRAKLIENCYNQLAPGGYMVFITISKHHYKYEVGENIEKDLRVMPYGVTLYFYDNESIKNDFETYGLIDANLIEEPKGNEEPMVARSFWNIVCRK